LSWLDRFHKNALNLAQKNCALFYLCRIGLVIFPLLPPLTKGRIPRMILFDPFKYFMVGDLIPWLDSFHKAVLNLGAKELCFFSTCAG